MTQADYSEPAAPAKSPPPPQNELFRYRLIYARGEALRYTSHLEMHLVWERTLRRAKTPLAYSQGFNPRPRFHMACALPLGFLSRCEISDFWISLPPGSTAPGAAEFHAQIQAAAPPGLEIQSVEQVSLSLPALQTLVQSAEFAAAPLDPIEPAALETAARQMLDAETLPRERRGKAYDLRPLIERLEVDGAQGRLVIVMQLSAREGATGRPEEVLDALGCDPAAFRVERTRLILSEG